MLTPGAPRPTTVSALLAAGTTYSFEFFPPRDDASEAQLAQTLGELEPLRPSFVSITYGAGGSTRDRTHGLVVDLLRRTSMTPMAHLTCVGHSRDELAEIFARYRHDGVENILALRGDPPAGTELAGGDLRHAVELVELARELGPFSVGVAAHPEGHPQAPDRATDRRHLAAKLARADFAVTQFFFRRDDYLQLVDDLAALGVDKPVIAGIMPITNAAQIERFAALSGAEVPAGLRARLHAAAHDPAEVRRIGVAAATELCAELLAAGAPGLHFYTLNRSTATREIWAALDLPEAAAA
ncbi:MAG TPA: methylenetetrahydrofolate reductase [NAD(P)H] [Acidimicrobiia bacterium]|nr:methylenetetrahydrofolate reductase [NAD(P)H] [Acidimicrobiia bacterium]